MATTPVANRIPILPLTGELDTLRSIPGPIALADWCVASATILNREELIRRLSLLDDVFGIPSLNLPLWRANVSSLHMSLSNSTDANAENLARRFFQELSVNGAILEALFKYEEALKVLGILSADEFSIDEFSMALPVVPPPLPPAQAPSLFTSDVPAIQSDGSLVGQLALTLLGYVGEKAGMVPIFLSVYLPVPKSLKNEVVAGASRNSENGCITAGFVFDVGKRALSLPGSESDRLMAMRITFSQDHARLRIIDSLLALPNHVLFQGRSSDPAERPELEVPKAPRHKGITRF